MLPGRRRGEGLHDSGTSTVDITNPYAPGLVRFAGVRLGSHDQTRRPRSSRRHRPRSTPWSSAEEPSVIGRILDPTLGIQQQAEPVTVKDALRGERTFVAVPDEVAGAAGNGSCPGGGTGIYDVTGDLEKTPVRVGYGNIPEVEPAGGVVGTALRCTRHVLRSHPEQQLMTIGWYDAGVRVVDTPAWSERRWV